MRNVLVTSEVFTGALALCSEPRLLLPMFGTTLLLILINRGMRLTASMMQLSSWLVITGIASQKLLTAIASGFLYWDLSPKINLIGRY